MDSKHDVVAFEGFEALEVDCRAFALTADVIKIVMTFLEESEMAQIFVKGDVYCMRAACDVRPRTDAEWWGRRPYPTLVVTPPLALEAFRSACHTHRPGKLEWLGAAQFYDAALPGSGPIS